MRQLLPAVCVALLLSSPLAAWAGAARPDCDGGARRERAREVTVAEPVGLDGRGSIADRDVSARNAGPPSRGSSHFAPPSLPHVRWRHYHEGSVSPAPAFGSVDYAE
jgi:hypothetical protein